MHLIKKKKDLINTYSYNFLLKVAVFHRNLKNFENVFVTTLNDKVKSFF